MLPVDALQEQRVLEEPVSPERELLGDLRGSPVVRTLPSSVCRGGGGKGAGSITGLEAKIPHAL